MSGTLHAKKIGADIIRSEPRVTGNARNSLTGKCRSPVPQRLRSNNDDINKGIGYYLLEPLPLSDEREELLLLLVLSEEERLSVFPLETLLRFERLLLRTVLELLLLLRVELELLPLRVEPELLRLLEPERLLRSVLLLRLVLLRTERFSFRLLEFSIELLFARLLSRLEPEVVELPVAGRRTELEFISGRR